MKQHLEMAQHVIMIADAEKAVMAAQHVVNMIEDELNRCSAGEIDGARTRMVDSIFARALIARAAIGTAAAWWAEVMKIPEPEAHLAMMELMTNPPAWIDHEITKQDGMGEQG